jgi:co-chaperonin GroES (HSP10)
MSAALVVSKAKPLFRDDLRQLPGCPGGNRVLVRPKPIESMTEGALITPDVAKARNMAGWLMAAGEDACDKAYDRGYEPGDEVWFGKYAGLIEEWQHIVKDGRMAVEGRVGRQTEVKCAHDGAWDRIAKRNALSTGADDPRWQYAGRVQDDDVNLFECRSCGALKVTERVLIMDFEDIVMNVDLQARFERGDVWRVRRTDHEGRERYVIQRKEGYVDRWETKREAA